MYFSVDIDSAQDAVTGYSVAKFIDVKPNTKISLDFAKPAWEYFMIWHAHPLVIEDSDSLLAHVTADMFTPPKRSKSSGAAAAAPVVSNTKENSTDNAEKPLLLEDDDDDDDEEQERSKPVSSPPVPIRTVDSIKSTLANTLEDD